MSSTSSIAARPTPLPRRECRTKKVLIQKTPSVGMSRSSLSASLFFESKEICPMGMNSTFVGSRGTALIDEAVSISFSLSSFSESSGGRTCCFAVKIPVLSSAHDVLHISMYSRTHNPIDAFLASNLLISPYLVDLLLIPGAFHPLLIKPFSMRFRQRIPRNQRHF